MCSAGQIGGVKSGWREEEEREREGWKRVGGSKHI